MRKLILGKLGTMKIQTDPLPVMGSQAFLVFIYEFDRYLRDQGMGLTAVISNYYSQYDNKNCGEFQLSVNSHRQKRDTYRIIEGVGYAINPQNHEVHNSNTTTFSDCDKGNELQSLQERIDQIALCHLSRNFMFTWIIPDHGKSYADFFEWLKNQRQYVKPHDLVDRVSRMIYQRSALVSRGLLGGYYL
ncbi:hypothetical protein HYY69_05435 [Candidatus Woesearchaeota archaeon]|nr:hypothetical protein [Candidatus Woesearchaeota archaeon]